MPDTVPSSTPPRPPFAVPDSEPSEPEPTSPAILDLPVQPYDRPQPRASSETRRTRGSDDDDGAGKIRRGGKTVAEMIADFLREAAVLVAVFGWLDKAVKGEPFWGPWGWTVIGAATILLVTGVVLERVRSSG